MENPEKCSHQVEVFAKGFVGDQAKCVKCGALLVASNHPPRTKVRKSKKERRREKQIARITEALK